MGFIHELRQFRAEIGMAWQCIAGPRQAGEPMEQLRSTFWTAALSLACVVLLASAVLWWRGKIGAGLSIDAGKWCSVAGGYFAGWGTWIGLLYGGSRVTWGGRAPHETASAGFFKLFFLVGVFLSTIGAAWWG